MHVDFSAEMFHSRIATGRAALAVRRVIPAQPPFLCISLYIDESGDGGTNPGSSHHLVLAGVAIHEGQWRGLTKKLDAIQDSHFPQAGNPIELHASGIRDR